MYLIPDVKKGNKSEADVLFWFTELKQKGAILRMQSEEMAVTCFKYPKSYFEILSVFNEKTILSKTQNKLYLMFNNIKMLWDRIILFTGKHSDGSKNLYFNPE